MHGILQVIISKLLLFYFIKIDANLNNTMRDELPHSRRRNVHTKAKTPSSKLAKGEKRKKDEHLRNITDFFAPGM